jgi:hypothetical protein
MESIAERTAHYPAHAQHISSQNFSAHQPHRLQHDITFKPQAMYQATTQLGEQARNQQDLTNGTRDFVSAKHRVEFGARHIVNKGLRTAIGEQRGGSSPPLALWL